jgi:hypothetical protein
VAPVRRQPRPSSARAASPARQISASRIGIVQRGRPRPSAPKPGRTVVARLRRTTDREEIEGSETLTIGTSLFLIAVGAILKYAVTAHVEGVDIQTVGVILMVVGVVGLLLGLFLLVRGRSPTVPPTVP